MVQLYTRKLKGKITNDRRECILTVVNLTIKPKTQNNRHIVQQYQPGGGRLKLSGPKLPSPAIKPEPEPEPPVKSSTRAAMALTCISRAGI
ncbi:hypothetical protein Hanom_Chr02g00155701 [Helianthus anomalus]